MPLLTTRFLFALGAAACALAATGCAAPGEAIPCPRREAAFRLELTAPGASIPPDTTIEVVYQGNETETFSLVPSGVENEDVCCRLGAPTDGVLPHVACLKNPPPVTADASTWKDAGGSLPSSGDRDASPPGRSLDAGADARAGSAGSAARDASIAESAGEPARRMALFCELLTNGPATIHVTASGYRPRDQQLESKLRDDNCGVRTVDVHTTLLGPDGGEP